MQTLADDIGTVVINVFVAVLCASKAFRYQGRSEGTKRFGPINDVNIQEQFQLLTASNVDSAKGSVILSPNWFDRTSGTRLVE